MRAVVVEGPRRAVLADVEEPHAVRAEVVVRIERAGVCGSDVAVFRGKRTATYPLIIGHEAAGRVVDTDDPNRPVGMQVVIEPNIPCGMCRVCRGGLGHVCPSKRSLGMNSAGTFADYVAVPSAFVHHLPADVSWEDAAGIEPLAVAVHAFRTSGARTGDHVAVVGCGAEGLLLLQVAVAEGANVLAVDIRTEPLALARRLGASGTLLLDAHVVPQDVVREWCPSVVFEAAGARSALEFALRAAAPGGRIVALGLDTTPVELVPLEFVRRGLTLVGSLIYEHPTDFVSAIELVRHGRIRPGRLTVRTIDLADVPAVLADERLLGKTQIRIR